MALTLARRQFLAGLFVAPAIVRASSLMAIRPVNCLRNPDFSVWNIEYDIEYTPVPIRLRPLTWIDWPGHPWAFDP